MTGYLVGLIGMLIFCDGLISIRLYLGTTDESGKRIQSWKYDHSIRLIRMACALCLIIIGGILI